MILCFGHAQTAFGSEITLPRDSAGKVCVCARLIDSDEINSSSSARVMTERDGLELERRRLLAIIRTRKSLH